MGGTLFIPEQHLSWTRQGVNSEGRRRNFRGQAVLWRLEISMPRGKKGAGMLERGESVAGRQGGSKVGSRSQADGER